MRAAINNNKQFVQIRKQYVGENCRHGVMTKIESNLFGQNSQKNGDQSAQLMLPRALLVYER